MSTLKIDVQKTTSPRIKDVDWNNLPFGKVFGDHSFLADYKNGKWDNPRIVPFGPLCINPGAPGLHYGQTIFEGLKAVRNKDNEVLVFRPQSNSKRLNISAERILLAPVPEELFMEGMRELIKIDREWAPTAEGCTLYIRPFLFASDAAIGLRPPEEFIFMIITCPVGGFFSKPIRVKIESHYTRAAKGGTGYAKAGGNYAGSLYPAALAAKDGYDQLLWTDAIYHRYIEEAGTMNVMFVINNALVTPSLSDSILEGINRDSVLTLAREWGMKVEERLVDANELIEALKTGKMTEAFGVGTAVTIAPIGVIGYDNTDYSLPPVTEWKVAPKVLAAMDDIKRGKAEDKYNWIVKM